MQVCGFSFNLRSMHQHLSLIKIFTVLSGFHYPLTSVLLTSEIGNQEVADAVYSAMVVPWYLSWYAFLVYFIAGLGVLFLIYKMQKQTVQLVEQKLMQSMRSSDEKEADRKLKQSETDEFIYRSEIKELKKKLRLKTIELAAKAKESDEQKGVIFEIQDKLDELEKHPESMRSRVNEIRKIIDPHLNDIDHTFEIQFGAMNEQFFKSLKERFPNLTSNDLRLCAYVKMGYNSKEIAEVFSIKPSSVYISRSRLRKKLDLDTDDDLHTFLSGLQ